MGEDETPDIDLKKMVSDGKQEATENKKRWTREW
jgi:hypothetical protein